MKNKIYSFAFILITIISISSYASASFEITPDIDTLVPDNALIYFQIANPYELTSSADAFLKKTGINEILNNMSLLDFISMNLDSKDSGLSMDYLNLNHPIGVAIFPNSGKFRNSTDVEYIVFIPIKNNLEILEMLANFPKEETIWYKIHMNYLVFFSSKILKDNFPSNKIVNLSTLDKYSEDSLSIYYDTQGIINTFGFDTAKIIEKLEYNNSDEGELASRIIQGYLNLFNEMDSSFSNIKIDRNGISLERDLFFSEKIEGMLRSFKQRDDIKKWEAYLPKEGIFQSIYSLDSNGSKQILGYIMDYLFPESEDNPKMLELKQNINILSQYSGNGGAFSFNIIPSANETGEFPFDISINMVTELSDSDTYLNEFRNLYSSQSVNNIMNNLYSDSGFKIQLKMEELSFNEISPVYKLKYIIKEKRTKSGTGSKELPPVLSFLNGIEFWYYISEGKMYSYIGAKGVEGVKELVFTEEHEKEWVNLAPDNSNFIWNISLKNIFKLLEIIPELGSILPKNNLPFDISGYSNIENGSVHSNANISSKDIGNIYKLFKAVIF